ncbi:MAG: PEP-CTERM sorting domain-containing protein [Lacipirellulaceae bacterium]
MSQRIIALLAAVAVCVVPADAFGVLITETLTGEVLFGDAMGATATATFTYDDALITGIDEEFLVPPDFSLSFTFLGQTFIEDDDTDFPDFPELGFLDGVPVSLDFVVIDGDGVGDEILDPVIFNFSMFDIEPDPAGGFFGEIFTNFSFIPEPTTAMLAGLAMVGFATRRKTC